MDSVKQQLQWIYPVQAAPAEAYAAFTQAAGWQRWCCELAQVDPRVGAAELLEHPGGRTQDPRTLVGVRIQDDRREMEGRQPLHDRAALTEPVVGERREDEVGRELLADLRRDGACGVGSRVGHGVRS